MKENNIIAEKSFAFAVIAIDTYKLLRYDRKEFVMSTQFLRSSTSIAANIEEAIGAQSTRDFYTKFLYLIRRPRETKLWIRLIKHAEYITLLKQIHYSIKWKNFCRILGKIQLSIKEKL